MTKTLLFVLFSLIIAPIARAQEEVTIINPGFELPDGGAKITDPNLMDGWNCDITDGSTNSGREASGNAPEGAMIGFARNIDGRIYQEVDVIPAAETEYSFRLQSTITWGTNPISYCVTYYSVMDADGSTSQRVVKDTLATEIGSTWTEIHHNIKFAEGHAYAGKRLIIEYAHACEGGEAFSWAGFDDLKLLKFVVEPPVGVKNTDHGIPVNVYPNPASDHFMISAISFLPGHFILYSIDGRMVKQGNFTHYKKVELSGLNGGMYLLHVTVDNRSEVVKLTIR